VRAIRFSLMARFIIERDRLGPALVRTSRCVRTADRSLPEYPPPPADDVQDARQLVRSIGIVEIIQRHSHDSARGINAYHGALAESQLTWSKRKAMYPPIREVGRK